MSHRRVALVSGASSGIGRATALLLARSDFHVFAGVRRPEDGESVQTEAEGELEPLILDVTEPDAIAAAVARLERAVPGAGLAALVNNAGTAYAGPLEVMPLDDFRRQLEVNLVGQLALIQAFMPMLRARRGRIVNVTSIGGLVASPFYGPYCASKFGLEALSDCLRVELRPWGVKTIAIEPGSVATRIWDRGRQIANELRERLDPEAEQLYGEAIDAVAETSAEIGARGIPPEEVARTIHRALTVKRPKARYLVGRDARGMVAASRLLPDRAYDAIVRRAMNLP